MDLTYLRCNVHGSDIADNITRPGSLTGLKTWEEVTVRTHGIIMQGLKTRSNEDNAMTRRLPLILMSESCYQNCFYFFYSSIIILGFCRFEALNKFPLM